MSIPQRGWLSVARRVFADIGRRRLGLTAAGVAFYGLLALFPAIAAIIAVWGLFADPAPLFENLGAAAAVAPPGAIELMTTQATAIAGAGAGAAGLALAVSVGVALFSASRGAKALMQALNIVYGESERRNILEFNLVAAAITAALSLWLVFMLGALIVLPIALRLAGVGENGALFATLLKWPLLVAGAWAAVTALFRYAPCRRGARWRWITPGAAVAVGLWLAVSVLFSAYAERFADYNATYGAIAGVIALLMWLWLSAFVLLLGAQTDAELERQTEEDTTRGPDRPMGERGAAVADNPSPARERR